MRQHLDGRITITRPPDVPLRYTGHPRCGAADPAATSTPTPAISLIEEAETWEDLQGKTKMVKRQDSV